MGPEEGAHGHVHICHMNMRTHCPRDPWGSLVSKSAPTGIQNVASLYFEGAKFISGFCLPHFYVLWLVLEPTILPDNITTTDSKPSLEQVQIS